MAWIGDKHVHISNKMKLIIFLTLFCFSAYSQSIRVTGSAAFLGSASIGVSGGSGGGGISPTNLGAASLAWYDANTSYVTNTSVPTWTDLWTNHWDLTNRIANSTWPTMLAVTPNGSNALCFSDAGATTLNSVNYTSSQPHEVCMALSITNVTGNGPQFMMDGGISGSFRNIGYYPGGASQFELSAGGLVDSAGSITNKWFVINFVFNGASSKIYTNNVAGPTVDAGSGTASGLTIGSRYSDETNLKGAIAEIASYSAVLTTTQRSNLFYYMTNKYGITP